MFLTVAARIIGKLWKICSISPSRPKASKTGVLDFVNDDACALPVEKVVQKW